MAHEPIAVWSASPGAEADELVRRVGGHRTTAPPRDGLFLSLEHDGLALIDAAATPPLRLRVDFLAGRLGWRLRQARHRREALGHACDLGRWPESTVLDATAGTGADSALLATLGARVTALERSPVVAALLVDGLRRAADDPRIGARLARLSVHNVEASTWIQDHPGAYDVICLDPMFEDTGSAAAAKPMAMLRRLIPPAGDCASLLRQARGSARRRVVVKRHRNAEPLAGVAGDFSITGKSVRFDVYLPA